VASHIGKPEMRPALKQLLQAEAKGKATLEQGLSKEDLELLRNTFDANMTDVMAVAKETSPDAEALAQHRRRHRPEARHPGWRTHTGP